MRVSKSGSRREKSVIRRRKGKSEGTKGSRAFFQVLQSETAEQIEAVNVAEALEEIDEYARKLKKSPTYQSFLRYKKRVQVILRFFIEECYTVREQSFFDGRGRRRLFLLVENIDKKLEGLTKAFLNEQLDSLELVSRLDEIRGLLLDLYT